MLKIDAKATLTPAYEPDTVPRQEPVCKIPQLLGMLRCRPWLPSNRKEVQVSSTSPLTLKGHHDCQMRRSSPNTGFSRMLAASKSSRHISFEAQTTFGVNSFKTCLCLALSEIGEILHVRARRPGIASIGNGQGRLVLERMPECAHNCAHSYCPHSGF